MSRTLLIKHRSMRGGILFEIMLSIAIFAGAALFTLRAVSNAVVAFDRSARRQQAMDVARSTLAELEVGLITIADLRDRAEWDLSRDAGQGRDRLRAQGDQPHWVIEIETELTEYTDLTLVALSVRESSGEDAVGFDEENAISITLRQLMALQSDSSLDPRPYREDELVEDLVQPRGSAP